MMEEDPVEGGILYGEKGKVSITEIPGLGASINEDFLLGLKKITV